MPKTASGNAMFNSPLHDLLSELFTNNLIQRHQNRNKDIQASLRGNKRKIHEKNLCEYVPG